MYGWTGRVLHINLTKQEYYIEKPDFTFYGKYIGGKGAAGFYLKKYITYSWDSEYMPLIFFTGPLVNTMSPTSGRSTVMSRSPLTGTVGDTSVGGGLGHELKRAGIDGIIITGKSNKYIGISINDSKIEFNDAGMLKGKYTDQVTAQFKDKGSVCVIGPAAENGVMFANIMIDEHFSAGRNGLGLVMASKNLKYITVKGSKETQIFDKQELLKAREEIFRLVQASPALKGDLGISNYGTGALYDLMHSRRMMPANNFKETYFDNAPNMNAWHYKQKYHTKKTGCYGCHILCKKQGKNKETIPEFETMSHFSALIGNKDIDTVVKANAICNKMGMDTISAGSAIACYQEINNKKIKPKEFLELLTDISLSKGIGKELKRGSYRYAESLGRPETSISVKKLELPAYDPRGAYGMALAYVTSTRGGCHLRAYPIAHEILRKPVVTDRFTFSGKARIIKISEDLNAVIDSLTACKFLFFAATLEEYAKAFYGVTGVKTSAQDLLKIGERIYYNERVMNSLNGFSAKHDDLPERFFKEPGSSGSGITINPINRDDFLKARADYYKIRGLNENGMPLAEKCSELGIDI
ncbi:aldehyde ferredoxin oxidoreductase family protein [bacterium]